MLIFLALFTAQAISHDPKENKPQTDSSGWRAPDINLLTHNPEGELIRYGRDLIVNTSHYFGPKGTIGAITNGMNCQNCHIGAGVKMNGNNFAAVAANYPRYRDRSGKLESIEFRVNDCMLRSLNGKSIDSLSKEMRAIVAYLKWLGAGVASKSKPAGSGIVDLSYLTRAADPVAGKLIYQEQCTRCHGQNGEGVFYADSTGYRYPPLWGEKSYNVSAGLYRLSRLASFIKYNMPFDKSLTNIQLSDEQSWDVAAFICSQQRPDKKFPEDWPNINAKPPDFPFGPYTDQFSEQQHKYGPFVPIQQAHSK
jgi:thiosulfate dehydrogenase